jgi:leucyl-tRNA synthetase
VPADIGEEFIREKALAEEKVRSAINGREILKVIVVPGKLVNIVVR